MGQLWCHYKKKNVAGLESKWSRVCLSWGISTLLSSSTSECDCCVHTCANKPAQTGGRGSLVLSDHRLSPLQMLQQPELTFSHAPQFVLRLPWFVHDVPEHSNGVVVAHVFKVDVVYLQNNTVKNKNHQPGKTSREPLCAFI